MIVFALILAILLSMAPQCAVEDGSTQSVCVWHGRNGATVVNLSYGETWFTMGGE